LNGLWLSVFEMLAADAIRRWRRHSWTRFALRHCNAVGDNIVLEGRPHIRNLGFVSLGDGVTIKSSPVVTHMVTAPGGSIRIGTGVSIGHGASISAHTDVILEDGVKLGALAIIIDTDFHDIALHDAAGISAPITIGRGAILGPRVTVLRGSHIGAGAIVEAGSVVTGEISARARVRGVPAREYSGDDRNGSESVVTLSAVLRVVAETFGLQEMPDPYASPENIEAWDSLGTLNLLLSLEEAFGVTLSGEELSEVRQVADLVEVIEAARERGMAGRDVQVVPGATGSEPLSL
jgi:acetyltransferase-like isoleucine patch superfamily enzyme/acyl carrier protein